MLMAFLTRREHLPWLVAISLFLLGIGIALTVGLS